MNSILIEIPCLELSTAWNLSGFLNLREKTHHRDKLQSDGKFFSKLLLHRYSVHWYFIFMLPRSDGENVETEEEHEGRRRFSRQADIISCHAAQIILLVPFTPFISSIPPFPFLRPLSRVALSSQRYIYAYSYTHVRIRICMRYCIFIQFLSDMV